MRDHLVLDSGARKSGRVDEADALSGQARPRSRRPPAVPALQSLFDPLLPPGLQWYWRADFVQKFTSDAIGKHLEHASKAPPGLSQVHVYPIDGAAHRVGKGDTAFSYRDANFAVVIVGIDPNPANKDEITKWCKDYFDALHPYSAGGAYVNFMMGEG